MNPDNFRRIPKGAYIYTLTHHDGIGGETVRTFSYFPESEMDELDAEDIYWNLTVRREGAIQPSRVWKGLYY